MAVRARLRERFADYRTEIEDLVAQVKSLGVISSTSQLEAIAGYIDSGNEGDVFRLPSEPNLVVKLPYENLELGLTPRQITKRYVEGLVLGLGVRGLAEVVAYNDNRRQRPYAIVMHHVDGPSLRSLSHQERYLIRREEYVGAVALFQNMQERRLRLVDHPKDIIRTTDGFTILDYDRDPHQTLVDKVTLFASNELLLGRAPEKVEVPSYGLLYRDACEEVLGGNIAAAIDAEWRRLNFVVPA